MRRPNPRKNVLLINPWIYDFTAYDFWLKPLGLLYVASILREQAEVNLHFINCLDRFHPMLEKRSKSKADGRGHFLKEEVTKPEILKAVPRNYSRYGIPVSVFKMELERIPVPDLVLMTCTMTYWYPGVQLAVELVRETFGAAPIVLGGIYATLAEDHARQFSGADKIITGPAENKIIPLVREIWGDGSVREAEFPSFKDMPCPAFDLLNNKDSLPLLTSRGCPFTCAFCAGPLLYDRFEQRNPEDVVAEIADHAERFGTRHFAFYDDALLLKPESHIIPILEEVVRRKWPVSFHTPNGLHIREIDQDMAHLFRKADVRSLYLSQESTDRNVIREACPKVAKGDLERAIGYLEKAGYRREDISVYLMAGLPNQDATSIRESVGDVRRLGAKPRMAYFSPIPGTRIWRELVDRGRLKKDADPLIQNKMAFPYLWADFSPEDFKDLQDLLNEQ
jgi:radical SAM superfamily enzyme YgiQ (UPF0313 family)